MALRFLGLSCAVALVLPLGAQPAAYDFDAGQKFLKQYCQSCHQGNSPAGKFNIQQLAAAASVTSAAERWNKVAIRVRNGEMPPKGLPAPPVDERENFTQWVNAS